MRVFPRLLSVAICAALLLTAVPFSACALTEGDYEYEIIDNGVSITKYTGSDSVVDIPETLGGLPVRSIGNNAFSGKRSLTSVSFPDTVLTIGTNAFYGCLSLTDIDISPFTYRIGYEAFHSTAWYLNAESGPLYIGRTLYSYSDMADTTVLYVKDGTASIAPHALQDCESLKEIYLPVGIRYIDSSAFISCTALTDIRIPPTVVEIASDAFYNANVVTIHGVTDSVAALHAEENSIHFVYDETLDYPDGDMNKDGTLTSNDCRTLLRALMNKESYDHERFLSCDFRYDGVIDSADARQLLIKLASS